LYICANEERKTVKKVTAIKRFWILLAAISVVAVACQTDNVGDEPAVKPENHDVELSVSLAQTRTSLGDKDSEGIYPLYWSEEDRIVVNGALSEAVAIDENNASKARFVVKSELKYPYNITYPYIASTTAERAIVEFPAEQNYAEGTFSSESAPMCGYIESGKEVSLSHLAAILRLPIKASDDGAVLDRVVVTSCSGAKISGEFVVNCKSATIAATDHASSVVTYSLPDNYIAKSTVGLKDTIT
jgi:hypothetical protein